MFEKLKEFYQQIILKEHQTGQVIFDILIVLGAGVMTWWAFNLIFRVIKKRCKERPFFQKNKRFLTILKKAGHYSILLVMGAGLIHYFNLPIIDKIFSAFMIILLASFLNTITRDLIPYLENVFGSRIKNKLDDVIFDLLKRFASIIIFATAIILAMDKLGINIMPFVAGAGVAGIAIGFAAKDTLSNIIAGVLLLIDRPFEVGDRIEVWTAPANSATWGDVLDVGLRATKIKTTDNIIIVIPNNEIMKRDIINYTTITNEIRVRIPVGIAYGADTQKAKEIICRVALEMDWVMEDPEPKVVVKGFGDSSVNLEARVWIREPRKRIDTISHITDRVKDEFERQGIEIPFPKRDIYIRKGEF